jgi:hypothetical protein
MEKVEVQRIVILLNDIHEDLCEGDAVDRTVPGD